MALINVKVGLDPEEYESLKKAIKEEKLYASESFAGRRGFYLLRLEREGKLKILEPIKKSWE